MTDWIRSLRTAVPRPPSSKASGLNWGAIGYGSQIHNPPRQRPIVNEPVRGLSRLGRAQLCTKRIEEV